MIYSVIRKFTMQRLAPHTQMLIRTLKIHSYRITSGQILQISPATKYKTSICDIHSQRLQCSLLLHVFTQIFCRYTVTHFFRCVIA